MTVIGPAEIQILADASGFKASLERQLAPGLQGMTQQIAGAIAVATGEFDTLGDTASDALTSIDYDNAFADLTNQIATVETELTDGLTDTARKAVDGMADEFDATAASRIVDGLDIDTEFKSIVDGLDNIAADAVQDIESEFDDIEFGTGLIDQAKQTSNQTVAAFQGVAREINSRASEGIEFGSDLVTQARTVAGQLPDTFDGVGRRITESIAGGVSIGADLLTQARTVADRVVTAFQGVGDRIRDQISVGVDLTSNTRVVTEAKQLATRIGDGFKNIGTRISNEINTGLNVGPVAQRVTGTLTTGTSEAVTKMRETFRQFADRLPEDLTIRDNRLWSTLVTRAGQTSRRLVDQFRVSDRISDALTSGIDFGATVANQATEAATQIRDRFDRLSTGLGQLLRDGVSNAVDRLADTEFGQLFNGVTDALRDTSNQLVADIGDTASELSKRFKDRLDLIPGFEQVTSTLVETAQSASRKIGDRFKDGADRANTALRDIGQNIPFGDDILIAARRTADRVVSEFKGIGSKISTAISSRADFDVSGLVSSARSAASRVVSEFKEVGPEIGSAIKGGAEKALKALPKLAAAAGLTAGIGFAAFVTQGIQKEQISDRILATLVLDPAETQRIAGIAGELYSQAYGDSFEDITLTLRDALAVGVPDDLLRDVVKQTESMEAAFGGATEDYLAFASQLQNQGLTDSIIETLDLTVASFQRLPTQMQEPLLEAVREYGQFIGDLGFSTEEIFALLARSAEGGEFALDKAGDALKEFTILSTDLSTSSVEAFESLGLSAEEMAEKIIQGGPAAKQAFDQIVEALLSVDDPVARANAAIALFGTPLEDLSVTEIPAFLESLLNLEEGFGNVEGAASELDATMRDNFGTTFEQFKRTLGSVAGAIANAAIGPALEAIQPHLERFADWMRDEGPAAADRVRTAVTPIIESMADALREVDWEGILVAISDRLENIDFEAAFASIQEFDWGRVVAGVEGFVEILEILIDVSVAVVEAFEQLAPVFRALGDAWDNSLFADTNDHLETLGATSERLAEQFAADWDEIVGWLNAGKTAAGEIAAGIAADWEELAGWNRELADGFAADWEEIMGWLGAGSEKASEVKGGFAADWAEIMGWSEALASQFATDWDEIQGWIDAGKTLAGEVAAGFAADWAEIMGWNSALAADFRKDWAEIKATVQKVFDFVSGLFSGVSVGTIDVSGLLGPFQSVITKAQEAIGVVKTLLGLSGSASSAPKRYGSLDKTSSSTSGSGGGGGSTIRVFGEGGLATVPSLVAEDFNPEIVLPLTKQGRMQAVLNQYADDIITAAGGIDAVIGALTGGAGASFGADLAPTRQLPEPATAAVSRTPAAERLSGVVDQSQTNVTYVFNGAEAGEIAKQIRDRRDDLLVGLRIRG